MNIGKGVFLLCAGLLAANTVQAQGAPKKLSKALQAATTVPAAWKNTPLSKDQLHALESSFFSLEEARRAIVQDPGVGVSKYYRETIKQLHDLNLSMPARPKASASPAEKEQFLQQLNRSLYQESRALAPLVGRTPRPLSPDNHFSRKPLSFPLSKNYAREDWEPYLKKSEPTFSWGTPNWDQVRVKPYLFSTNPSSPNYLNPEVLESLRLESSHSKQEMFDIILADQDIPFPQKQHLISLIEEASSILTYDFTQLYFGIFGQIPQVESDLIPAAVSQKGLEVYATSLQHRLLYKLERKGAWTDQDFELFAQASAYLPAEKAKAVIRVVTYLEPRAALWVLRNPLDNPTSQRIIKQANDAHAAKGALWPDGNLTPKLSTVFPLQKYLDIRIETLQAYNTVKWKRFHKLIDKKELIEKQLERLENRPLPPDASLEDRLEQNAALVYMNAQKVRLDKLVKEAYEDIQQTEDELNILMRE